MRASGAGACGTGPVGAPPQPHTAQSRTNDATREGFIPEVSAARIHTCDLGIGALVLLQNADGAYQGYRQ